MKRILKNSIPMLLVVAVLSLTGVFSACGSTNDNMYKRSQSNKARTVKSNIKVKGTNRANGHTTRSY